MLSLAIKTRMFEPIAMEISRSRVRMVQLGLHGDNYKVLAAEQVVLDEEIAQASDEEYNAAVLRAIEQMKETGRFRGKQVVSCLPSDMVQITSVRISGEESDLDNVLGREMEHRFGLDMKTDTMHYLPAGSVRQGDETKSEYILFAVSDQVLREHISLLERAGFEPVAIDNVPCALFRSFERFLRRQADREQTYVFVDVGTQFSTIVFTRDGEISFIKQIPIGTDVFDRQIADRLNVSMTDARRLRDLLRFEKRSGQKNDEIDATTRQAIVDCLSTISADLARDIQRCFKYYTVTFRGKRVERVVFTGEGSRETIVANVMKRQLAVNIEVSEPFRGFDISESNLVSDEFSTFCDWAIAVGVGLKDHSMRDREQG